MQSSWFGGLIIRFALVALVSLGVVGGSLGSLESAAAMPRTRCETLTDLSDFYLTQANLMYRLGYYQLAATYYQRHIDYNLAALAVC